MSALDAARGAARIEDVDRLTAALAALLREPAARQRAADAARTTVEDLSGALERTLASLEPYLLQLRLGRRHA